MTPISLLFELSGITKQWIQHFHSEGQCKGRKQLDECTKIGWIDQIKVRL